MLHPDNESKDILKLIDEALSEVRAMSERHFRKHPPVLHATIPANALDTDILLADALRAARDYILAHRDQLLRIAGRAVDVSCNDMTSEERANAVEQLRAAIDDGKGRKNEINS